MSCAQSQAQTCDRDSDGSEKEIARGCWGDMASMTGKSSSNTPTKLPNGDSIMVYPFGMHFRQAQCFCKSLNNGHLASIHDEMEYQALEAAAKLAGVTTAIFVGGHETAEGAWEWTDGTAFDRAWVDTHGNINENHGASNEVRLQLLLVLNCRTLD